MPIVLEVVYEYTEPAWTGPEHLLHYRLVLIVKDTVRLDGMSPQRLGKVLAHRGTSTAGPPSLHVAFANDNVHRIRWNARDTNWDDVQTLAAIGNPARYREQWRRTNIKPASTNRPKTAAETMITTRPGAEHP